MSGGELMIILIVAMAMIGSILKAVFSGPRHPVVFNQEGGDPKLKAETIRLHDEVVQLKERVKVLERIAIEKENSLAKEIEDLRNR
jgi:uncharacterized protein YlxW (UPF0749 family)